MGKRAERDKAQVKQQVSPWLYRVMVPEERIVAGVRAETGPPPTAVLAACLVLAIASMTYGGYELAHGAGVPIPIGLAGPALIALGWLNRPVFLAVTDRQVICLRLSAYNRSSVRLLFAVPLSRARITRYRQGRWRASLRCEAPEGGRSRKRQLTVPGVWQPDLEALIGALTTAGSLSTR